MNEKQKLVATEDVNDILDLYEGDLHPAWTGEDRVRGLVWHALRPRLIAALGQVEELEQALAETRKNWGETSVHLKNAEQRIAELEARKQCEK